jgi:hypothetical protein
MNFLRLFFPRLSLGTLAGLGLFGAACSGQIPEEGEASEALTGIVRTANDVCPPVPACDTPPTASSASLGFRHPLSGLLAATAFPNHRGRDLFLNPGEPQWVIGKFTYGIVDKDLKDEDVEIQLLRDCGGSWETLGRAVTTRDNDHAAVEDVDDSGGRIYFQIPKERQLGIGRHRLRLVVLGDGSSTELFIEVVPRGTPMFVSDVDGTLTSAEFAEFTALLGGKIPDAHADSAAVLRVLASKGYRPYYLTARPEFLVGRTREFLQTHGFPPGIVHTSLNLQGNLGGAAARFKEKAFAALATKGLVPAFAFGNKESDADAYETAQIVPVNRRFFFEFSDANHGGTRIDAYLELKKPFEQLTTNCR